MTTRQFITRAFNDRKSGRCSSVMADNGDIYSYGYHYPLLFRVGGQAYRNITGYSSTTGRHIQWSRDVDAIDVYCGAGFRLVGSDSDIMAAMVAGQKLHIAAWKRQMAEKRRKDTQVYEWLQFNHDRAVANLQKLQA